MSKEYEAVLKAIKTRNIGEIKESLGRITDPSEVESLIRVLIYGLPDDQNLIDTVDILLKKGFKLDKSVDDTGNTLLLHSLVSNRPGLAKLLIEKDKEKVSLDRRDTFKAECFNTPLLLAIKEGFEDIACLLLEKGANPELPTKVGIMPFGLAAVLRQDKVIEALIKAGAKNIPDPFGFSPYEYYTWNFTKAEALHIRFPCLLKNDRLLVCSSGKYLSEQRYFGLKWDRKPLPLSFVAFLNGLDGELHDHSGGEPPIEGKGTTKEKSKDIEKKLQTQSNQKNILQDTFNDFIKKQKNAVELAEKQEAFFYTKDTDNLSKLFRKKAGEFFLDQEFEPFEQFNFPYSDPDRNIAPALIKAITENICSYFLYLMSENEFNKLDKSVYQQPTLVKLNDGGYKMWGKRGNDGWKERTLKKVPDDIQKWEFDTTDPICVLLDDNLNDTLKESHANLFTVEEIENCLIDPINKLQFMIEWAKYEKAPEEKIQALTTLCELLLSGKENFDMVQYRKEHPELEKNPEKQFFGGEGLFKQEPSRTSVLLDELEKWVENNQKKEEKRVDIKK